MKKYLYTDVGRFTFAKNSKGDFFIIDPPRHEKVQDFIAVQIYASMIRNGAIEGEEEIPEVASVLEVF